MNLNPVRGMRDFFPDQMEKREWLFSIWKKTSELYSFQSYDAPVVENLDLLKRKAGEDISDQLYTFEDKSGRELALRGEMTPSLARMIASRVESMSLPVKWYSIGQCFRYERMTRGRKREHYQWNVDILGVEDISAEAEIMMLLIDSLTRIGLTSDEVEIRISSRKIIEDFLRALAIPKTKFIEVMMIIDKFNKLSEQNLQIMLKEIGLKDKETDHIFKFLSCKNIEEITSYFDQPVDKPDEYFGANDIENLFKYLKDYKKYIKFDISVVRGLSYYTGIVFEVYYRKGSARAIAGGGRYDHLLESLGGKKLTGVGFGFGDVVIMNILEELGKIPVIERELDYYIIPYAKENLSLSLSIANKMRIKDKKVDIDLKCRKVKTALKEASKRASKWVVILFPDEIMEDKIVLKNMITGDETKVEIKSLY